ncbi:MAG: PEP-CTERM sorting domain-containing protein [Verrucomicrobiota bacterium]
MSAGTEYAYDISASNGFFGFATEQEGGYDGGNALLFDSSSNISSLSSDRTFYVEGNPVPEPSTWIMVGMGLLGLTMLRHRFPCLTELTKAMKALLLARKGASRRSSARPQIRRGGKDSFAASPLASINVT